jgi:hypothetical protein
MGCSGSTGCTGPDDQDITDPPVGSAHTLRMSASFSARCFSSSAMNLSRVF